MAEQGESFAERVERWHEEAPARAAKRAERGHLRHGWDLLIGLGVLVVGGVIGLIVLALLVALVAAAWMPVLGFLIGAAVIAAISIVIRRT